jgi:hypothetical protein
MAAAHAAPGSRSQAPGCHRDLPPVRRQRPGAVTVPARPRSMRPDSNRAAPAVRARDVPSHRQCRGGHRTVLRVRAPGPGQELAGRGPGPVHRGPHILSTPGSTAPAPSTSARLRSAS